MNIWTKRAIIFVLACMVAVAASAAIAYRYLWTRYDNGQQLLEARSERLQGVVAVGPQISAALDAMRQSVAPWLHPAGDNAQNDAQQRLRERIAASGATLVSSQVALDTPADGKLPAVRLTATVDGEWANLVAFLEALQTGMPPLWVRTATFAREGQHTGAQGQKARLTVQLEAPLAPAGAQP